MPLETQVVLDLGLSRPVRRARSIRAQVKAFRRPVDRRGGPDGPAPTITTSHVCLIDVVVEAKTAGDFLIVRVLQHELATADQHRHVCHLNGEPIEQRLDVASRSRLCA
jgi:hypothetical protein